MPSTARFFFLSQANDPRHPAHWALQVLQVLEGRKTCKCLLPTELCTSLDSLDSTASVAPRRSSAARRARVAPPRTAGSVDEARMGLSSSPSSEPRLARVQELALGRGSVSVLKESRACRRSSLSHCTCVSVDEMVLSACRSSSACCAFRRLMSGTPVVLSSPSSIENAESSCGDGAATVGACG